MDGFISIFVVDSILLATAFNAFRKPLQIVRRLIRSKSRKPIHYQEDAEVELSPIEDHEVKHYISDDSALQDFASSIKKCVGTQEVGISYKFNDISLTLKSGKSILAPQSGFMEKGSIWGVMGESGAGKSTFVQVLMGKTAVSSGTIFINGTPTHTSRFNKLVGFVPQHDVLLPQLTVREQIWHSARIRLPSSWDDEECLDHVNKLITCLGLAHIQHQIVGPPNSSTISGGQRKRVAIGIELAAAPVALFLDEPTSGLDATTSLSIMKILKAMSHLGVTIICIIHQPRPEILGILDGIHLLSDGHAVYHGDAWAMGNYFESIGFEISGISNIADAVLDIVSGHSDTYCQSRIKFGATEFDKCWNSFSWVSQIPYDGVSIAAKKDMVALANSASIRGAPWFKQVLLCVMRSMKQQWRCKTSFMLEILVGAICGLLIGLALYELRGRLFQGIYLPPFELLSSAVNYMLVPEVGLLCCMAIGLAASTPAVKTFGEEREVYWREASTGHSRSAYYVGKMISTIPRLALSAIHFTTFYCSLATPIMSFWLLYVVILLYFYCIYGLASIVSMVVQKEDGPLLSTIVSLVVGVFGGYGPPLNNVKKWHLEWLWRLCPGIWLTEALFDQHLAPLSYLYDLDVAAEWTGYVRGRFVLDLLLLLILGTIYRLIAFMGLIYLNRKKQR